MKLTFLCLLLSFVQLMASKGFSQSTRLTLNLEDARVEDVLVKIEEQSNIYFIYNREVVDVNRRVDVSYTNQKVTEVLRSLFNGTGVEYEIRGSHIILKSKTSEVSQNQVSGNVTDLSGSPLPGVTVVVKGTTQGTITDADGNYSLSNIPSDGTLVFSFVGMKTQEIQVAGKTKIDVTLAEETIGIDEVVAIGYGTMRKADLTGSVSQVKVEEKDMQYNPNIMSALQGVSPGVNIGIANRAGETPEIQIRGMNSLNASNDPLIVLDGIIYNGSLSDINMRDVETIDVLKDASSTAVYGSRAANGVILITTKKGIAEKPTITFSMYQGISNPSNLVDVMDGEKYIQKLLDAREAAGLEANPSNVLSYLNPLERDNYSNNKTINWYDEVIRQAKTSEYHISIAGQTKKTNYYLSGSYTDENGIALGDDFSRLSLKANFDNQITDWFKVGLKTMFTQSDYSGVTMDLHQLIIGSPYSTYWEDEEKGLIEWSPMDDNMFVHPLLNENIQNEDIHNNIWGLINAKIDVPFIKGLSYNLNFSTNYLWSDIYNFYDENTWLGRNSQYGDITHNSGINWTFDNIINYDKKFNDHSFKATLLYSREYRKDRMSYLKGVGFTTTALSYNNLGVAENQFIDSEAGEENSISYMGRIVYGFKSKYLLTATIRRDGSSVFAENYKYANFPSVALGWVATEESWLNDVSWLNFLKLRASYGENGNQAIQRYATKANMATRDYIYGSDAAIGFYPSSMALNDLKWETTTSLNFGLDFSIINQNLWGAIDVYTSKTKDLLVKRSLPSTSGYGSVWTNLGQIHNHGVEISLNSRNISTSNFMWTTNFAFSINRNRIDELYGVDSDNDGVEDDDIGSGWFINEPINSFFDRETDGIYQIGDNIPEGLQAGDYRIVDQDGDGAITTDDRTIVGYSDPNYRFSINNNFKYKNFNLTVFLNSAQGGGKKNYYIGVISKQYAPDYFMSGYCLRLNMPDIPYWTENNPTNKYPRISYQPKYSHEIYEDRSFVRLQDVTLSYDFDNTFLKDYNISNLRLFITGKNLYTWTKWGGYDPERGSVVFGFDNQTEPYPTMRTYLIGLNLSF